VNNSSSTIGGTFFEAASVCLSRHHDSPVDMNVVCNGELIGIIDEWAHVNRIEQFFADVAQRAEKFDEGAKLKLLDRLRRARELMGSTDALEHFLKWKSPEER
jgi:hypothetical protein